MRLRDVFRERTLDAKKEIDTAAIKAEASLLLEEIRSNLDRLDALVEEFPEGEDRIGDTVTDA